MRADKAYSSRPIRAHLRSRGITAVIPEPADRAGHRRRRGSRDGPPAFNPEDHMGRSVVERSSDLVKQWRGPAIRYDTLALTCRGRAVLRAITLWLKTPLGDMPQVARNLGMSRATLYRRTRELPQATTIWGRSSYRRLMVHRS